MKQILIRTCADCPQPTQTRPGYCARAGKNIPGGLRAPETPVFCPLQDAPDYADERAILYKMARLARNTDGLHPSTAGPVMGQLLLALRLLDGERYNKEVIQPKEIQ